jgi:hypothetical protein
MDNRVLRGWCLFCGFVFFLGDIIEIAKGNDHDYQLLQIGVIFLVGYGIMSHIAEKED